MKQRLSMKDDRPDTMHACHNAPNCTRLARFGRDLCDQCWATIRRATSARAMKSYPIEETDQDRELRKILREFLALTGYDLGALALASHVGYYITRRTVEGSGPIHEALFLRFTRGLEFLAVAHEVRLNEA